MIFAWNILDFSKLFNNYSALFVQFLFTSFRFLNVNVRNNNNDNNKRIKCSGLVFAVVVIVIAFYNNTIVIKYESIWAIF